MKVLIAGATGALGTPIVTGLVSAGHQVTGIARTAEGASKLRSMHADAVIADALDREGLLRAVTGLRADAVMHQLTALKKPPTRFRDMAVTNDLRTRGSAYLMDVARLVGAHRFVTQSIVFGYGFRNHGDTVLTEESPFGVIRGDRFDPVVAALRAAEEEASGDPDIAGIALRYGLLYGGDIATMRPMLAKRRLPVTSATGLLPLVHHSDAAAATVAAVERGGPGAYNIVDDTPCSWRDFISAAAEAVDAPAPRSVPRSVIRLAAPYAGALMTELSMTVSNAKARSALDWAPRYTSCGEGFRAAARAG